MDIASTAAAGASSTQQSRQSISSTYDSFLTLLTTQLKYQDPASPMDTNEFTNQLVGFSQVEQGIQTNERLDTLIGLQGSNQIAFASSLSGKYVELQGNAGHLEEDGTLTFGYRLPSQASETTINIMNEAGVIVYSTGGKTDAGSHSLDWDGTRSDGGQAVPGTYRIQVVANDTADQPMSVTTSTEQLVTGVSLATGDITLEVGRQTVSLANILAIRESKTTS